MKAELIDKYRETDFIQSVIKSTIMNFGLFCFIVVLICAVFYAPIEPINKEFIEPLYNKVDQLFSTFKSSHHHILRTFVTVTLIVKTSSAKIESDLDEKSLASKIQRIYKVSRLRFSLSDIWLQDSS